MRHILIDTDTASDDAVALLMALREPDVRVEAITTVAGNCPLEQCVKNALICVEKAGTYAPPVYAGMAKPLFRTRYHSHHIHGEDGMGDMALPDPQLTAVPIHAIDAIIDCAARLNGELEIVTLGPLTNLAMAVLKAPALAEQVKRVYVMGGSGLTPGNITPLAEFNFYADAEAAHLVLNAGLPLTLVGWEIGMGEAFIGEDDIERLHHLGELGRFAVRCNRTLMAFNAGRTERKGFDLPDPTTMAVALYPDIVETSLEAYSWVEYKSERSYGHYIIDSTHLTGEPANARVITRIKPGLFKEKLFSLLSQPLMK
ncbi:TPA: ribonucleoside hydrolase [Serratia marcescens]|nr:ribonucleoside hydrolase [Serratia marcescens]